MLDARGYNCSVSFDGEMVTIRRFGILSGEPTGIEQQFPLSSIRAIKIRTATLMLNGSIEFTVRESGSKKSRYFLASFLRKQTDEFKFLAAALEAASAGRGQQAAHAKIGGASASAGGQPPPPPIPIPAGWYPDPDNAGLQRYWDGNGWTDNTAPAAPPN